jgi:hypothetical protein
MLVFIRGTRSIGLKNTILVMVFFFVHFFFRLGQLVSCLLEGMLDMGRPARWQKRFDSAILGGSFTIHSVRARKAETVMTPRTTTLKSLTRR